MSSVMFSRPRPLLKHGVHTEGEVRLQPPLKSPDARDACQWPWPRGGSLTHHCRGRVHGEMSLELIEIQCGYTWQYISQLPQEKIKLIHTHTHTHTHKKTFKSEIWDILIFCPHSASHSFMNNVSVSSISTSKWSSVCEAAALLQRERRSSTARTSCPWIFTIRPCDWTLYYFSIFTDSVIVSTEDAVFSSALFCLLVQIRLLIHRSPWRLLDGLTWHLVEGCSSGQGRTQMWH